MVKYMCFLPSRECCYAAAGHESCRIIFILERENTDKPNKTRGRFGAGYTSSLSHGNVLSNEFDYLAFL